MRGKPDQFGSIKVGCEPVDDIGNNGVLLGRLMGESFGDTTPFSRADYAVTGSALFAGGNLEPGCV